MDTLVLLARYGPILLVWLAMNTYVAWRLITPAQLVGSRRVLAWSVTAVLSVLPLAALTVVRLGGEGVIAIAAAWAGFLVLGFTSILIAFVLTRDAFAVLFDLFQRLRGASTRREQSDDLGDPARREFLTNTVNLSMMGSAGALTGVGLANALQTANVREVEVPIEDLDPGLDGLRIVQLSDLHVGPTVRRAYVERIVERVNDLQADLIALTGDFVDGSVDQLREHVAPLGQLSARHGVFFASGNHEYYSDVRAWLTEFRRLGIDALENEHRVIEHENATVVVAGVHDYDADRHDAEHRSDPAQAIRGAPRGFRLLLAHQPRSVFAAEQTDGFDLQLSGHTHGGQYFPMNIVVWLAQPYLAGLHRAKNLWIYVNRGCAYWGPPVRVGAPTEIALLRLKRV